MEYDTSAMTTPSRQSSDRSTKKKKQNQNRTRRARKYLGWKGGVTEGMLQNVIVSCGNNNALQFVTIIDKLSIVASEKGCSFLTHILHVDNLVDKSNNHSNFVEPEPNPNKWKVEKHVQCVTGTAILLSLKTKFKWRKLWFWTMQSLKLVWRNG